MTLFTTDKERRLWLWTLAILVVMYSTIGSVRVAADVLRDLGLLRVSVGILTAGVVAGLVWPWIKKRPGWPEIGVALGIAFVYWLTFLRVENPAERTHLVEYGVIAALVHQALLERSANGRGVYKPAALAIGLTAAFGLVDELIQLITPGRFFDWADVLFNTLAGFMVVVARLALDPVRAPGWRLWFLWSLAGAIGWGVTMDAGLFGGTALVEIGGRLVELPNLKSLAAGTLAVGLIHSMLLARYVRTPGLWFAAAAGTVAVGLAGVTALRPSDPVLAWQLTNALFAPVLGTAQWLVLRREVSRAWLWIPATILAWAVALPVGDMAGPPGWAIFGALTGALLVWMLRKQSTRPASWPVKPSTMRRILVVGSSCSGKSTFAARLSEILDIPHTQLDALNHLPDWQERPHAEFRALVDQESDAEAWIIDGNYSRLRPMLWPKATHLVWLNYSYPLVVARGLRRTIRRVVTKEELFSGNRETFRKSFLSRDSVLHHMLVTFHRRRRTYRQILGEDRVWSMDVVELATPQEAESYLAALAQQSGRPRATNPS